MNCEHTMTDKYGVILHCTIREVRPASYLEKIGGVEATFTNYYCDLHYPFHAPSTKKEKRALMKAKDVLPDDIYHSSGGNLYVLDVQITAEEVELKLASGRTDPGGWLSYLPDKELDIYRPEARS